MKKQILALFIAATTALSLSACEFDLFKTTKTEYAYTTPQGEVYFYCECQKCGWKKNMTPQEAVALDHICDLFEVKELLTSRYSKEQGVS